MQNGQLALIAVIAALAMLGVVVLTVAVTIPLQQQAAEAVGCKNSIAFNASKGRCFQP
jgi:ACT domain-containing protein